MDFKCGIDLGGRCKNSALCHLCDGKRLLKLPKEKIISKKRKKKEGMDFEKKAVKKYNQASKSVAYRRPNSGAIRDLPGDFVTPTDLAECKERGTTTSKGEKTITIHLDWILKVEREMRAAAKDHWYIPFGFKGTEEIYLIKSYDHELEMIQIIQTQQQKIKELEERL